MYYASNLIFSVIALMCDGNVTNSSTACHSLSLNLKSSTTRTSASNEIHFSRR